MRMPDGLPYSLQILLSRHQNKVDFVDDERDTGDGYWVYLKPGWIFDHSTTFIHESSVRDVAAAFKRVTFNGQHPC